MSKEIPEHLESDYCPHCGVDSPNLTKVHNFETECHNPLELVREKHWGIYVCRRCGGVVAAEFWTGNSYSGAKIEGIKMYPSVKLVDESIPDPARTYLQQALASIHAPAAAIMVAASAIDAMLKAHNYENGNLHGRIEQAAKDHLITATMSAWAHEVRLDANDQRHADKNALLPTQDDAVKCVEFSLALAEYLFVLPARVKRGLKSAKSK